MKSCLRSVRGGRLPPTESVQNSSAEEGDCSGVVTSHLQNQEFRPETNNHNSCTKTLLSFRKNKSNFVT